MVRPQHQTDFPSGPFTSCMAHSEENVPHQAHPRRVARVAKQIEREVGTLLLHDRVSTSSDNLHLQYHHPSDVLSTEHTGSYSSLRCGAGASRCSVPGSEDGPR